MFPLTVVASAIVVIVVEVELDTTSTTVADRITTITTRVAIKS